MKIHASLALCLLAAFILAACSAPPTAEPSPTPEPQPSVTPTAGTDQFFETVDFQTSDGTQLSGRIFGNGPTAVILAHMGGATQGSWYIMAKLLAEEGFTVMTFDFRGVGQSEGFRLLSQAPLDLMAAVELLEARGHERIACVGASYGGTACMAVATEYPFIALAVLSSRFTEGSPNTITTDELAELTMPKLFISSENDHLNIPGIIQEMYDISQEPKQVIFYPGGYHGTALFLTTYGSDLEQALIEFLRPLL
jgi:alpha/beta superfamily hydrolase